MFDRLTLASLLDHHVTLPTMPGQFRRRIAFLVWLSVPVAVVASAGGLELHVRVNTGTDAGGSRVWLQPADAEGRALTGPVNDFMLELEVGRQYLLAVEQEDRVPEVLHIDARLPEGSLWKSQPPLDVRIGLEAIGDQGFDYTGPTGTILFRTDIDAFGFSDGGDADFPWESMERLNQLIDQEIPRTLEVRSPKADCDGPAAPHWLAQGFEPCDRTTAVYELRSAGSEGGLHLATIHSLDGALKARASYEDACHREPHGIFIFYHPNGNVESTGAYVHGHRSGTWNRYDPAGRQLAEKFYDPAALAGILGRQRFSNAQEATLTADRYGTLATVVGRTPPSVHVIRYREEVEVGLQDHQATTIERRKPPGRTPRAITRIGPRMNEQPSQLKEELLVDRLNVTMIVRVDEGSVPVEYRRVVNYYGPVYYFRNGESCTAERYAQATGR